MVEFRNGWLWAGEDIPDGEYCTISEFAELYDIPESSVRTWLNRGQLPFVRCYGRVYIPENAKFRYNRPWMTALRGNEMTKNW